MSKLFNISKLKDKWGTLFFIIFFSLYLVSFINDYGGIYFYFKKVLIEKDDINNIINEYSDECFYYFLPATFSEKRPLGLVRYEKEEVLISLLGGYSSEDFEYVKTAVNMLNSAIGYDKFLFCDLNIIKSDIILIYIPKYIKNKSFGKTSKNINSLSGEIKSSMVFVYDCDNQSFKNRVVMHELLHAIGFSGHPGSLCENSFLSDKNYNIELDAYKMVEYEAEAIRLLYDKRLPNHLSRETFLRQIYNNRSSYSIDFEKFY